MKKNGKEGAKNTFYLPDRDNGSVKFQQLPSNKIKKMIFLGSSGRAEPFFHKKNLTPSKK